MKQKKTPVISERGQRAVKVVAGLRLLSAILTAAALVLLGSAVGDALVGNEIPSGTWIGALVLGLLAGVCAVLEADCAGREARAEERQIRSGLLATVFRQSELPKNATHEFTSGRLIGMMTDSAERVTEYRQVYFGSTIAAFSIPILILGYVAIAIDPIIGLGGLIVCPLIPLIVMGFLKLFRKVSSNSRAERARLTSNYLDAIRNLVTIRIFGAGPRIEKKLRDNGEANRGAIMKLLAGNQIVIIVIDGIASLLLICWIVFLTATRMNVGAIDGGEAVTVILLLTLLLEPLGQIAGFFYIGMGGIASERAIRRYLDSQPAAPKRVGDATADISESAFAIDLSGVRYDYGRGEVLHGIDLTLPRGETAAIIGPSGSGKSTLLSLLKGALPPQGGTIFVGGRDLSALTASETRSLTAGVSQSTWMFTGTIADNLRIGKPDASEEEMWEALKRANVEQDVKYMPQGLLTEVGERASMLSGGQAQRLSLARALLSGRNILLLDEPTSHVDMESEAKIIDAIDDLRGQLSILIITHRPSMLRLADSVWEMSDGTLAKVSEVAR